MRVVLSIGGAGRDLALTIRAILAAQAAGVAREIIAGRWLPSLYRSGVAFRPEATRGQGVEYFDDPWTVLKRGYGDCDDLVVWRAGELVAAGEPAGVVCMGAAQFTIPRYHVAVRRADGSLEDPSKVLIRLNGRLP